MIGGAEVDTSALAADRDALFTFIREFTNHPEMEFGEVVCSSEFRPNIRMVDRFGEGRAFLIGGKWPSARLQGRGCKLTGMTCV